MDSPLFQCGEALDIAAGSQKFDLRFQPLFFSSRWVSNVVIHKALTPISSTL